MKIGLCRASDQVKNTHYPFAKGHKKYDDIYHDYSKKNDNNEVFEEEEDEIQLENDDELTISEAALQQQNHTPFAPSTPLFYKRPPQLMIYH